MPEMSAATRLSIAKARRALYAALELVPVEVEGWVSRWATAELLELAESEDGHFGVSLLPFADNLIHLQGGPAALTDELHHGVEVPLWGRGRRNWSGPSR